MSQPASFCPQCGALLEEAARFCAKCGAPVSPAQPWSAPAQPRPAQASGGRNPALRFLFLTLAGLALLSCAWLYLRSSRLKPAVPQDLSMAGRQRVEKAVQEALKAPVGVTKLDLSGGELARLPNGVEELSGLRELALNVNPDLDLCDTLTRLAALPGLERLELAQSSLKKLPAEVGALINLKELLLWQNELETLPPEIGNLKKLQWINLSMNAIAGLPAEMSRLGSLTHLDLSDNGLSSIPPAVCAIPGLQSLDLSKNYGLASLPSCIAKLEKLEFLGLSFDSELKSLPPELARLQQLREVAGVSAGYLEWPGLAPLRESMKNTTFSGERETALLDHMSKMDAVGAMMEEKERQERKKRIRGIR